MNDAAPLPEGTLLGAKFRLDRLIGKGGMGAVYLAENVDIGRKVAVKVLLAEIASDQEALTRFRTEARAAAVIGHPNIAEVIDFGTTPEGGAYLVMEYLEGETLGARLRRAGPMDASTVAWVGDEVLAAVAAAHTRGVIHRDLKPDNVFLVEQPVRAVKVLDFGVSKFRRPGEAALTRTGVVMGTPAYMSPEQARGAKDVGPASDLYSVGAILYESLTGAPAFNGESYNEVLAKVLTEPHRPLGQVRPGLPPALVALVDRMLGKTVQERPADAGTARRLLAQSVKSSDDAAAPTLRPMTPQTPPAAELGAFAPTTPRAQQAIPTPVALVPQPITLPAAPAPAAALSAEDRKGERRLQLMRYAIVLFGMFIFYKGCISCEACRGGDRSRDNEVHAVPPAPSAPPIPVRSDADEKAAAADAGGAEEGDTLEIQIPGGSLKVKDHSKHRRP